MNIEIMVAALGSLVVITFLIAVLTATDDAGSRKSRSARKGGTGRGR